MREALKPFFQGESGEGRMASSPGSVFRNQVDTHELARAGVRVVVASVWPPPPTHAGASARDEAVRQLDGLREFGVRHPDVRLVTSAADARDALANDQLALIPAVEGGEGIQQPSDVDLYFAHGARLMTVVHILDCDLGGSAKGQLTRQLGVEGAGEHNPKGLSALGKATVERMIDVGMMIDVAHASDATADGILSLAEARRVPVVDTHAGARAYFAIERNVSDELARRIVATGGMIGTTLFRSFLSGVPATAQWSGYQAGACDDVVAHWKRLADVAGPDAVVLGSDFNGMIARPGAGKSCPQGIRTTGDLPALYAALAAHGVSQEALDRGGLRFLDVLEKVEGRANPKARATAKARREQARSPFDVAM